MDGRYLRIYICSFSLVSDQGLYQLFLFDPNGVKVELNFANDEAIRHGINAPVKASEL
jgi:phenolic acid decarboxylase